MKSLSENVGELIVPLLISAMVYQTGFVILDFILTGATSDDSDPSAVVFLLIVLPLIGTAVAAFFLCLTLTALHMTNWLFNNLVSTGRVNSISSCFGMLPAWFLVNAIMGLENGFGFTIIHSLLALTIALVMGATLPIAAERFKNAESTMAYEEPTA